MPLISDLTVVGASPPMILPPLDVEWVWFCHTLNPVSLNFCLFPEKMPCVFSATVPSKIRCSVLVFLFFLSFPPRALSLCN